MLRKTSLEKLPLPPQAIRKNKIRKKKVKEIKIKIHVVYKKNEKIFPTAKLRSFRGRAR
jgi:hypothetical protein